MAEVTVDVAGRSYRVGCGEGEEEHLTRLARLLDSEARGLMRQFGSMPEGRLLLMTALLVADRLADTERQVEELQKQLEEVVALAEARAQSDMFDPEREKEISERIVAMAEKIEEVAEAVPG